MPQTVRLCGRTRPCGADSVKHPAVLALGAFALTAAAVMAIDPEIVLAEILFRSTVLFVGGYLFGYLAHVDA